MRKSTSLFSALTALTVSACGGNTIKSELYPDIFPDYAGVTIPEGMADLNFRMSDGSRCRIRSHRDADTIWYSVTAWPEGSARGTEYKAFPVYVSHDEIDPFIAYRLIEPGYESWHDMGIYQRELSSYREKAIVTNKINNMGCVNCHSFPSGDPGKMLFHARGKGGGTVIVDSRDGVKATKTDLSKTGPGMQGTYPAWHPEGRYVAFSSNSTNQCFFISSQQPLEVYDKSSDLILLDTESGEVSAVCVSPEILETFPAWSDDGKTMYYCAADNPGKLPEMRESVRYRLMALDFENGRFNEEARTVLDLDTLSISFPRVRGDRLVFTAAAYGTFPIWHSEADLWMLELGTGTLRRLDEINSSETESYHSWSSNGKWMIFSSRRMDGRYTRLYLTHCGDDGIFSKPFLLPQKNADHDLLRLKSYNIPEFVKGKVSGIEKEIGRLF